MLSRVAGNIYWMARYLERAEDMARLINVNANLTLDLPKGLSPIWGQLIAITGVGELYQGEFDERSVLKFLIAENNNPVSILSCMAYARENARTIRDVIPREVWEAINRVYLYAKDHAQQALTKRGRYPFLFEIISECQHITGILAGTMNHDAGYTFLKVGRNLERADMTSRIIDTRSANLVPDAVVTKATNDNLQWMSVLKSLTGYQMYRREMQVRIQRQEVLKFLIQSKVFPRAIAHAMSEVEKSLESLPNHEKAQLVIHRINRQIDNVEIAKLKQTELQNFMDQLQVGFAQTHEELSVAYFGGQVSAQSQSQDAA
ncbi:alpha-E domain-containing protein [Hahella sp. KA22]|uniref:alpha-E domain-containing protein n=1 Tax=Hahella sp. KA22 TaxID=1628392 RepID=UPI000FDD2D00|nr:alpha-E domain-containing protein [Hahella sp. KA22]AZZ90413.1 alpha-E domain-containing protein [Hahella sp. KA22]QAY53783.1 alpha-E domain-containing protein [Hahella sp. KA22]